MDRGRLGGLAVNIPLNQQRVVAEQTAPIEQQSVQYAPPVAKDPLAHRRGMTADYYDSYALLQKIVKDAMSQGIDPFKPDYSQPGGGEAFQAFTEAEALLMHAANRLGNELKAETQMRPLQATGQTRMNSDVDPQQGFAYSDARNFYSTALDPRTVAANQRTAQNVFTPNDAANVNKNVYDPTKQALQGSYSGEQLAYQQSGLLPSVAETSYLPRGGRGGLSQEDVSQRAELIRQIKSGIVTNNQTPINMLKLVPGVEDVSYVNTGDKIGLEVWHRGQSQPSFVDLSVGGGEGDINALLNRIEGQKNVPNEAVFSFDTKVSIPKSNVRAIVDDVKQKIKNFSPDVLPKLQEAAAKGSMMLPNGSPIISLEVEGPYLGFMGGTDLVVKYYPVDKNGKVNYSKVQSKKMSDPAELEQLVESNANQIAPSFGGGFEQSATAGKTIKSSDIPAKAQAAGYSPEEYTQLLQQRGIQIVN